jgi:Na+/melibiose symporter-like transporter
MLGVAMIGSLKTMLVSVNAVVATEFSVSYMAATALTGLPLIIGALAATGSQILSTFVGKRGIYLGSSVVLLVAALGNMHVFGSYGAFMFTRCLQGLAWGSFEGLVASSIDDLFFVRSHLQS